MTHPVRYIDRFIAALPAVAIFGLINVSHAESLKPTLDSIQQNIFAPKCTQCHSGANAPQGLSLEQGEARANLVGVDSREVPELKRVEMGNPDDSYLIHKLEGSQEVGSQMPLVGGALSQEQIDVIRQWIAEGS